ncbi:MAG: YggS family pyridoxal phosphate-dependent enzyme [Desulfobacterales bacterium]
MKERLETVLDRIRKAALACGRDPRSVRLVAVSKTVSAERVRAAVTAGVDTLGENYIQEARAKIEALAALPVTWHFIGHLQSNKAKHAVRLFELIHTVDSLKLAAELDRQAARAGKTQRVLVQVNVSGEASKSGASEAEAGRLVADIGKLAHLSVEGLMTMPPFFDQPEKARPSFRALRRLRDEIQQRHLPGVDLRELSMGMTGDFEVAIAEGATLVRIGTALFGERR